MEIWHRVGFSDDPTVNNLIRDLAITHRRNALPGGSSVVSFDMSESDARWPMIAGALQESGGSDVYDTLFDESEILQAEWVRLVPSFQTGYPEPRASWVQHPINYADFCQECGIGYTQIAPFHLSKEPRIGKNDFMSLNWTYALFGARHVTKRLRDESIRGIKFDVAFVGVKRDVSSVVEQIVITQIAEPALVADNFLAKEFCPNCRLTKYESHRRGWMRLRRSFIPTHTDCFQTREWFGAGGFGGFRELIVSNRVARVIIGEQWRGMNLKPIKLVEN